MTATAFLSTAILAACGYRKQAWPLTAPLLGRGLPMVTVFWTNWGAAKRTFPHAPVLAKPNGNKPYGRDPYGNYQRRGTYYDNDSLSTP